MCLTPGVIGAGFLMYRMYKDGRAQIEHDTLQTARALTWAVDAELTQTRIMAIALSTSHFVEASDWAGFHRRARELLQRESIGLNAVISDATGRQIVNTLRPYGEPLPANGNVAALRRVFESGHPVVSDIFLGSVSGEPRMSVDVPIFREGKVAYDLGIGVVPQRLGDVLRRQQLPADWTASISDSAGNIVSRTKQGDQFVGRPLNNDIVQRLQVTSEGVVDSVTKEGTPARLFFSRSPASGWTVAIAIPLRSLEGEWWRYLILLGLGVTFLFNAGAWFAWRVGGRVASSVQALSRAAVAMEKGGSAPGAKTTFREAEEAKQAMAHTADLLAQRSLALRLSNESLQQREAALGEAQRVARLGSCYFDLATGAMTCSPEMCRIFGVVAMPSFPQQKDTIFASADWDRLDRAMQEARRIGTVFELSLPARRADGAVLWIHARGEAVRDAVGDIVGLRCTLQDLTDQKRAEDNAILLHRAKEEARLAIEQSEMKSLFLANMSHELRTPLNAIIGFTSVLLLRLPGPLNDKQDAQLKSVQSSGQHLLSLINDLLDVASIEAGKAKVTPEPVNCRAIVDEAIDSLRPLAAAKRLLLESDIAEDGAVVIADRRMLSQILLNLIGNAIKFTDAGAVTVSLRQRIDRSQRVTTLSVVDTGVGIAASDFDKLFQAFSQVDASFTRRQGGTGLGLHLSRKLAQMMGGEVLVQSEVGKGSVFTLQLTERLPP